MAPNVLRNIPSVNDLLEHAPLKSLAERVSRNVVVAGARSFLENLRNEVKAAATELPLPSPGELAERIAQWIIVERQPLLRPAINATGVLLHTGLGRAPLAEAAIAHIRTVLAGYASVELDLETGRRSQRVRCVEKLLTDLTGAEGAVVVNNNAGAVMLVFAALAAGREVVVSRGQLIEIGDSFRLPEVMATSGARLREVGTTNKTRISDYESAIGEETAALMRVHNSNFRIVGFAEQPTLAELVELGRKRNVPVVDDIGSGALIDMSRYGLADEPVAAESVKAGADLVLFSGDKLLGGPQCGIIAGRSKYLHCIARHPMMRALRVDKITLAALGATLRLYRNPEASERSIPLLSLLSTPVENLRNRAERLAPQMAAAPAIADAQPVEDTAFLGGGSVPAQQIPTWCVALTPARSGLDALATALRCGTPAVVGRIQQNRLLLDLRSVLPRQDIELVEAVNAVHSV